MSRTTARIEYSPRPDLAQYLKMISPRMNTSEMDMVIYYDWRTRRWGQKSRDRAWADLGMPPAHARDAITKKIVPMEIYGHAAIRANEPSRRSAPPPTLAKRTPARSRAKKKARK